MKTLIEKLKSRKLASTALAYGLGLYLIKSGNVTEGIALITGAQASYNIGQGMADAKQAALAKVIEAVAEPLKPEN